MAVKRWLPLAAVLVLGVVLWFVDPREIEVWAAWVQVVGVLLAIGWSVRLQGVHAGHGARQAERVAVVFASNMHWVFRELNDACIKRSWTDFVVNRRILDEILSQGREVSLPLLEGRTLAMASNLRSIGVEALELTLPHTPEGNWRNMQSYFEKRLPNIAAWLSATGNPPDANGPTDYRGLRTSFSQLGPL
ncbi:hypothetical protein [Variovorax sp.]|uniref:hypothetical protein n=1 Tax=Variovorax sp. TaxID=1871043 RepID=UPI002D30A0F6|nr:hypothetical protein [Variovorax sp.]HYP82526.1 hypothetical protein [Variovorax sp.]